MRESTRRRLSSVGIGPSLRDALRESGLDLLSQLLLSSVNNR